MYVWTAFWWHFYPATGSFMQPKGEVHQQNYFYFLILIYQSWTVHHCALYKVFFMYLLHNTEMWLAWKVILWLSDCHFMAQRHFKSDQEKKKLHSSNTGTMSWTVVRQTSERLHHFTEPFLYSLYLRDLSVFWFFELSFDATCLSKL